jgi:transposase-like protein
MGRSRRKFTPEQKAAILREYLIEKVSVSFRLNHYRGGGR